MADAKKNPLVIILNGLLVVIFVFMSCFPAQFNDYGAGQKDTSALITDTEKGLDKSDSKKGGSSDKETEVKESDLFAHRTVLDYLSVHSLLLIHRTHYSVIPLLDPTSDRTTPPPEA